ncbi:hypothetical protein QTN47_20490 [Danxiaibacter flavus]|uniref:Uncharacterized protein n=1 Tax=Danxiaibacter flavus TaxID=3049108 RepID=A0ABV3ZMV5_9BACT|nr:hypothetical protein QNM32_20495 [Chitinophagaceae bacterium DXS]
MLTAAGRLLEAAGTGSFQGDFTQVHRHQQWIRHQRGVIFLPDIHPSFGSYFDTLDVNVVRQEMCGAGTSKNVNIIIMPPDQARIINIESLHSPVRGDLIWERYPQATEGFTFVFPGYKLFHIIVQAAADKEKWDMIFFWGGQIAPILKYRKAQELMDALIEEMNTFYSPATKIKR